MAFTTSDTFEYASGLRFTNLIRGSCTVYARNTNDDLFGYTFGRGDHPAPVSGTQTHTDWLIVQDDMGIK